MIVFSENDKALQSIDQIKAIHSDVESSRKSHIPDWAYRDVLFMLIYYSIASYELLERKLTEMEKEEVYYVFFRVGDRMGLTHLPKNYKDWLVARKEHLEADLHKSKYTVDLYEQYKKHLGLFRYKLLLEGQVLVIPETVRKMLGFSQVSFLKPGLPIYKLIKKAGADWWLKALILPQQYKKQIKELDVVTPGVQAE